jgi:hypothetical protein
MLLVPGLGMEEEGIRLRGMEMRLFLLELPLYAELLSAIVRNVSNAELVFVFLWILVLGDVESSHDGQFLPRMLVL